MGHAERTVEISVVPETAQPPKRGFLSATSSRLAVAPGYPDPPATQQQVMPDDHSESVPPLPIPNRTVKRLHADDSADSRVKVGNRQAPPLYQTPVSEPR